MSATNATGHAMPSAYIDINMSMLSIASSGCECELVFLVDLSCVASFCSLLVVEKTLSV